MRFLNPFFKGRIDKTAREQSERRREQAVGEKVEELNREVPDEAVDASLQKNVETLRRIFADVDVLVVRSVGSSRSEEMKFCIAYCDGVVNSALINDNILRPLMLSEAIRPGPDLMDGLIRDVLQVGEAQKADRFRKIVESITYGDTVLFAEGAEEAALLNTKGFQTRATQEPDSEKILSGPREGFNESLVQNLSLIRRKVRTSELKMKYVTLGRVTQTQACVCYIDRLVNRQILDELNRRLQRIDIDGVLDTNYITELIKDSSHSPFRATGYTERPDVVVGKLLEGRIAVFLDGTPAVLTVPYLFIENFQSSEDYYLSFFYTSVSRALRIIGFLLTITVPAVYIAIVAYHHEMLPTTLLVNIASERRNVPLPAAAEAYLMLIVFDILRETGVRMPSNIGQALSIVGALVIGQAAVDAKLVAAPMIIVVGLTGITSLLVPKMNAPVIYIRFYLLTLATTFGVFGFVLGFATVLIHILSLSSFGVPQVMLSDKLRYQDVKDTWFRGPWWLMKTRNRGIAKDRVRMGGDGGGRHD